MGIIGEVQQFQNYCTSTLNNAELYDIIVQDQICSVFPNLDNAFRISLSFMLTNVSSKRSFSQLKRIKNRYRTTMSQERLDSLSLLCIEADMLHSVDFDDVIKDFALANSRKRTFLIVVYTVNVCKILTGLVSV